MDLSHAVTASFRHFRGYRSLLFGLALPFNKIAELYTDQTLLCTVLIANYIIKDGKSNWMEGMILMCTCIWYCYRACHFAPHRSRFLTYQECENKKGMMGDREKGRTRAIRGVKSFMSRLISLKMLAG